MEQDTQKQQDFFVRKDSVVRKIWGNADTILFTFAGAAAEFALNRAVDWLYFTGKLPSDPLGRLFSTVGYARRIVFSTTVEANKAIDTIRNIHGAVESARGASIPDWAYRDVLFMLIHYSIASYELFNQRLTEEEKEEVYSVFYRMGTRMQISKLPATYQSWLPVRDAHLAEDLLLSKYTSDLFCQYKKHLGAFRYRILLEGQKLVVPPRVRDLLELNRPSLLSSVLPVYKLTRLLHLDWLLKSVLLPAEYKSQIKALDFEL
jgi:uncharacterized protein (DUF2236 family)